MRSLRHAWADLRLHPWRHALSAFSLFIGVLAVVAIETVGLITADVFLARAEQQHGRQMTVGAAMTDIDMDVDSLESMMLAGDVLEKNGGGLALLATSTSMTGLRTATVDAQPLPLRPQAVTYVEGRLDHVRRLPVLAGQWPTAHGEVPIQLVLNQAAAEEWGGVGTELDMLVTPEAPVTRALVVAVISDGMSAGSIYATMSAAAALPQTAIGSEGVTALMHHPMLSLDEFGAIADHIARAGNGTVEQGGVNRHDSVDEILSQLRVQQLSFLGVAALALVISALGLLNIGLASISERSRELVIRRAVGATRSSIVMQVLLAAVILGVLAAGVAAAVAVSVVEWWVPTQLPVAAGMDAPGVPWTAIIVGSVAAITTTLVGALIPAIVAARLDVAGALRD